VLGNLTPVLFIHLMCTVISAKLVCFAYFDICRLDMYDIYITNISCTCLFSNVHVITSVKHKLWAFVYTLNNKQCWVIKAV
jgi:hypothetical protein